MWPERDVSRWNGCDLFHFFFMKIPRSSQAQNQEMIFWFDSFFQRTAKNYRILLTETGHDADLSLNFSPGFRYKTMTVIQNIFRVAGVI